MDPALQELLCSQPPDREVEAIIRLRRPGVEVPGVRIVARFGGRVATCRLRAGAVRGVRAHPARREPEGRPPSLGPEAGHGAATDLQPAAPPRAGRPGWR